MEEVQQSKNRTLLSQSMAMEKKKKNEKKTLFPPKPLGISGWE